jgi:hypothetical protein
MALALEKERASLLAKLSVSALELALDSESGLGLELDLSE